MTLRNGEIADLFDLLGDLYELDGAVVYRVLAYRRAAKRFRETAESVWSLSEQGRLTELDDIGDTIAQKVAELRETGTMPALEKLRGRVPESLVEIVRLPGLGAKTARRLWQELDITTLEQLEAAAREGRLQGQAGFGERKEQQLLAQLEAGAAPRKRVFRLDQALELARTVLEPLRAHPACERADEAGSLRRRAETVGDVDVIAAATDGPALTAWLVEQPFVAEVLGHGTTKASVLTHNGVQLDLRVVPPESYGNLLQHFTGSKGHNVRMREDAQRRGMSISEWGIEDVESGEVFRTADEDEVYRHLGYHADPARAARGQRRARAGAPRRAARPRRARATCAATSTCTATGAATASTRCSTWSRPCARAGTSTWRSPTTPPASAWASASRPTTCAGRSRPCSGSARRSTASSCWPAARSTSWATARSTCPTTCSPSSTGCSPRCTWRSGRIPTASRSGCWRRRSIPCVDAIGHPSGRMIGKRDGYAFDVEALVGACAAHGTFLEINSQPHRLDLRPGARAARARRRRQARDLHRRAPARGARLPGARGLHGPARRRHGGRRRQHAAAGQARGAAQAGQGRADVSEPDRSSEGLVFVSTGRRLAAAKVGRRWHEVRGPLMIAAALASIQALLLFVVLRMLQDWGVSLRWFVPIVALTTLALVAWLGLVRAAFGRVVPLGQAPAAAILETLEAVRGALRGGFDAASAQVVAYEIRERLGYAAVSVVRPRARARARRPRRRSPRRGPRRRRRARSTRCSSGACRGCPWAGSTAATAATARCARPSSRRS